MAFNEAVAHGRVASAIAAILRVRAGRAVRRSFHLSLSKSALGWVVLYKTVSKDPTKPWGFFAKVIQVARYSKEKFEKPPMLTKSLTKRTLARRSLQLDQGHGDLLIVRCVAPPGTLQEYANFAHSNLQMPSANTLPKCTVEVEVSRADDLPQADLLGKSDPFVEIYCGGAKIGRTKTIWKTLNPKWDGEFFKLRNVPDSACFPCFSELQLRVDGVNAMLRHLDAVDVAVSLRVSVYATLSFDVPGIVHNVQDEMDGKLELRVMDDELVSTPDFLGYAQLEQDAGAGLAQPLQDAGPDHFWMAQPGPRRRPCWRCG